MALSLPAVTAPVCAQAQEAASDANAQYRKAFDALAKQNWAEARRLLLPLWAKSHTWDVAAGLGQAEFLLKNYADGAQYTAFALANVPPKEKTKTVDHLKAALVEMKAAVGTARISVSKDAAEVLIDGQTVGVAPLLTEVYLNPGSRQLEARLSSGGSGEQTLEVTAGQSYQVALIVEKPQAEAAPTIVPQQEPPKPATQTPTSEPPISHDNATPNWAPVLITGGLAIVAVGFGTGFALDASSAKSDGAKSLSSAEAQFGSNPCTTQKGASSGICQELQTHQDRRSSSSTGATISFVAGGVFAAAAVASYFLWAKPESTQGRVDAWVAPNAGGLRLQGSF
jgi:hypothetical protein